MVRIAPVRLQYNPKTLWFDPGDLEIDEDDAVIVTTERGTEFGYADGIIEVEEDELDKLKSKLQPVLRVATDEDREQLEEMRRKGEEALPIFKQMAAEANEDMHPVMVEYLFDGDKAIFFFEAEERIDFRDLVRKLATEFHIRVDMRQIGVRDEARLVGGLGHCGQELCCKRLGGEFCPVSIRMAKEQDLSLNPQKISGVCGRLMCCLRYEYDAYKEFKSRAPKANAKITTPAGIAKVVELDVPREMVTVKLEEDNKKVTFPLSAMDPPEEGSNRPNSIGEVFSDYADRDPFTDRNGVNLFDTAGFTRDDKLGEAKAHHNPQSSRKKNGSDSGKSEGKGDGRKPRRRGRGKGGESQDGQSKNGKQNTRQDGAKKDSAKGEGQKSGNRRKRGSRGGQNRNGKGEGGNASNNRQNNQNGERKSADQQKKAVRPGQKSSGLHNNGGATGANGSGAPSGDTHRKARRRTHKTGTGGSSDEA